MVFAVLENRLLAGADTTRGSPDLQPRFWDVPPLPGPDGPGDTERVNARFLHQVPEADGGTALHEHEGSGHLPGAVTAARAGCRPARPRLPTPRPGRS